MAGLATFCLTGFKPKPTGETAASTPRQMLYYFYTYPYDFYNDRKTLADEEYELWVMYGFNVDTSPSGGTLLMKGYFNDAYPHNQLPMVLLYGHFPFMVK
jgi:hypothetical protein